MTDYTDTDRIIAAIGQVAAILDVHTELLRHLISLAEPAPGEEEGNDVMEILVRIEAMLRQLLTRTRQ